MMKTKAIKFRLSGDAACFRKPDVNAKVYFTYHNIHRIALLGLLGAILGLKGYQNHRLFDEQQSGYPQFYEKLTGLKVAIRPEAERGYFAKKIQYFNNSVGYASKETGGNLQVFEQWLERPAWTIYLARGSAESELWDQLTEYLAGGKCVYLPYLGKNEFPAVLEKVEVCELEPVQQDEPVFIHSLFTGELANIDDTETEGDRLPFLFSERAPVALQPGHNFYILQQCFYTNCMVIQVPGDLLRDGKKVLFFL